MTLGRIKLEALAHALAVGFTNVNWDFAMSALPKGQIRSEITSVVEEINTRSDGLCDRGEWMNRLLKNLQREIQGNIRDRYGVERLPF